MAATGAVDDGAADSTARGTAVAGLGVTAGGDGGTMTGRADGPAAGGWSAAWERPGDLAGGGGRQGERMALTVEEFRGLIRLLEERPEWQAELRRVVVQEENHGQCH